MTSPRAVALHLLLLVAAIVSWSCQLVGGYDEFERSEPAKPTSQTRKCDRIRSATPPKTGAPFHGPILLLIDDPDATCFWVDQTEVSVVQYKEWLRDGSALVWHPDFCKSWKADARPFDPDAFDPAHPEPFCEVPRQPGPNPNRFGDEQPIRCVDWCEAEAYCRWAGKRLCKVSTPESNDEWQIACSAGYTQSYPFDPTPEQPCNYGQNCSSGCGPLPVAQDTSCQPAPGYPWNLGGNIEEWIGDCGADPISCGTRGGSYKSQKTDLTCSNGGREFVGTRAAHIGFRCCASLTQDESALLPN